jgi:hypothetical protein
MMKLLMISYKDGSFTVRLEYMGGKQNGFNLRVFPQFSDKKYVREYAENLACFLNIQLLETRE